VTGVSSKIFFKSTLGIIPAIGYTVRDNYSKKSIAWLEWLQHKDPTLKIQRALNGRGEYRIPGANFMVDGYSSSTIRYLNIRGVSIMVVRGLVLPKSNETAEILLYNTRDRLHKLYSLGYTVITT
jgi:hypothetical protein